MKKRRRSDIHGWQPKPKFTAGLNVSQADWDKIFGQRDFKKIEKPNMHFGNVKCLEVDPLRDPPKKGEKRHHPYPEDGFPCPCGKPRDHPIHIPRI